MNISIEVSKKHIKFYVMYMFIMSKLYALLHIFQSEDIARSILARGPHVWHHRYKRWTATVTSQTDLWNPFLTSCNNLFWLCHFGILKLHLMQAGGSDCESAPSLITNSSILDICWIIISSNFKNDQILQNGLDILSSMTQ